MRNFILAFGLLFAVEAIAGTLTLNGHACGEIKQIVIAADAVALTTDGTCTSGVVSPPVEPPTSTCPSGVRCIDRPWPIVPQETVALDDTSVLAIKVKAGASGSGKLVTAYTSGTSSNRQVAISSKPGDFAPPAPCLKSGTQSTTTYWGIGAANQSQCLMAPNQTYWVNIRHTTCSGRCEFILKGY